MGFVLTSPVSIQAGDTGSVAHRLFAGAMDKTQPAHGQIPTPPDFSRFGALVLADEYQIQLLQPCFCPLQMFGGLCQLR